jgi:hypothetical protein
MSFQLHKVAHAWDTLIVCDGTAIKPCTYASLIELVKNAITDLTIIATLLATVGFMYAGFKLLTSQGNSGAMKDAKELLMKILIGFFWILAAWILVYTITSWFLKPGYSILGNP